MTKQMTYSEVRDAVASGNIEGKRLPVVEFLDAQQRDLERLREVLTIPNITSETTSPAMFLRTLAEHEKGQPVNGQDLINALMWRLGNQRRELARLQPKLAAARALLEPLAECDPAVRQWLKEGRVSGSPTLVMDAQAVAASGLFRCACGTAMVMGPTAWLCPRCTAVRLQDLPEAKESGPDDPATRY